MSTAEILVAARELIAKGWVQGTSRKTNDDGSLCYCATGAIYEAEKRGTPETLDAEYALIAAIGSLDIVAWNDAAGRTKAEVVAAFDRAVELAREGA